MPKVNTKVKEKKNILGIIAIAISVAALVVAAVAIISNSGKESKLCSVVGVDMVTQKVAMQCE